MCIRDSLWDPGRAFGNSIGPGLGLLYDHRPRGTLGERMKEGIAVLTSGKAFNQFFPSGMKSYPSCAEHGTVNTLPVINYDSVASPCPWGGQSAKDFDLYLCNRPRLPSLACLPMTTE